MGPTKAIVKEHALYEAVGHKLIKDGFTSPQDIEDFVNHYYLVLPEVDKRGSLGCLMGSRGIAGAEGNTTR